MKPFSPLKPLFAAMFALAAATAGAQTSDSANDTYVSFGQLFSLGAGLTLDSWTFGGTQTPIDLNPANVTFTWSNLDLLVFNTVSANVSYSAGGWTFSNMSGTPSGGEFGNEYYGVINFTGSYGVVTMNPYPVDNLTESFYQTANSEGIVISEQALDHSFTTVTAVPEPESYAMLLAGLGLMGAIARRRSRKV